MAKIIYTLELVNLKYQTMKKRIETLRNAFNVIFDSEMQEKGIQKLEELELQYDKMYTAILKKESYENYGEVEKSIISYLARLEGKIEEYVYQRKERFEGLIEDFLQKVLNSSEYQAFKDMHKTLKVISGLEALVRYYSGYCTKEQFQSLQAKISDVKFECLLRTQVELMLEGKRHRRKYATTL